MSSAKEVKVIGVRHHSPACARLVRHCIREFEPKVVLIEGPCDFNDRISELTLGHQAPVAIFSYFGEQDGYRASWTPFCSYSPEWVALQDAAGAAIPTYFMDLPAWAESFRAVKNRYADGEKAHLPYVNELARKLGLEGMDSLWDHLFEQEIAPNELEQRLGHYFHALRESEPDGGRDEEREAHMSSYIAWAAAEFGRVLVVCGGYHKPVLEKAWADLPPLKANLPEPTAHQGSYLVPYSFKRLDSFTGYAAGMPSPAYYAEVWNEGVGEAFDLMLRQCAERLRTVRNQNISAADLIAGKTMSYGLASLRGHPTPLRCDLLDGLSASLLKEGLESELPWVSRAPLQAGTHPLLVELVAAFSGDKKGKLHPDTPLPPLYFEVKNGLSQWWDGEAECKTERGTEKSLFFHRLKILELPGVQLRGRKLKTDTWGVRESEEFDSALLERGAWGASLEQAAQRYLLHKISLAEGQLDLVASHLLQSIDGGFESLSQDLMKVLFEQVALENELARLGSALGVVLNLWRRQQQESQGELLDALTERALWLVEAARGPSLPADKAEIKALMALREASLSRANPHTKDVMKRVSQDSDSPPAIRGAALGLLWSDEDAESLPEQTQDLLLALSLPTVFGDFLAGLLALAREQIVRRPELVKALNEVVVNYEEKDFLVGLPSLRLAFTFLPPRERADFAKRIAEFHSGESLDSWSLLRTEFSPETVARNKALEHEVDLVLTQWGVL